MWETTNSWVAERRQDVARAYRANAITVAEGDAVMLHLAAFVPLEWGEPGRIREYWDTIRGTQRRAGCTS